MEKKFKRIFDIDQFDALYGMVASAFDALDESKKSGNRAEFVHKLKEILPDAKRYVTDRMNAAERNGRIVSGKFRVEKLVDDLTIRAYDQFDQINHKNDLRGWLIAMADDLFENAAAA